MFFSEAKEEKNMALTDAEECLKTAKEDGELTDKEIKDVVNKIDSLAEAIDVVEEKDE